jgi:hypothetical protein
MNPLHRQPVRAFLPVRRSLVCPVVCATIALLAFASCKQGPMEPSEFRALFVRWFVNPTPDRTDSLLSQFASCEQLEPMVAVVSGNPDQQAGKLSVVLADSVGNAYTLGYQTPTAVRTDTTYPLVVYLHGGVGTTVTSKGEKAYTMLSPLADSMQLFLASPSGNQAAPWWSAVGLNRILQTVRYMSVHYPINPNKIFLVGVSDGATGCYAAANTICAPFAGFIAVSGYGGLLPQLGMIPVPGNLMQRPIYNVNAGRDIRYAAPMVNQFLDQMVQQGVNITRKMYPKEDHGFDYRDREYGTIAGYIRSWSRPDTSKGFVWTLVHGYPNLPDNLIDMKPSVRPIGAPFISGFWKQDTLVVQAQSVGRFTIAHGLKGGLPPIVVINGGAPTKMTPVTDTRALALAQIIASCRPALRCRGLYTAAVAGGE